ncbi:serine hydrolase domain-containing protein [Gulosibacter molinativorax]|uniref:Serine hydrolase n=1 Tax=Gulosibacter molinativorax TaxID=256821 RepID=A0ABT7C9B3_9MICO|nr:serine hydrolase domain-containing protein [Gulosibacter molinativorax]MDJ1371811.1 serine hydrolase [Gulosibacter molinativorax]QUY60817.1 Beta-lactamase [Gulosibacter molinativorax]
MPNNLNLPNQGAESAHTGLAQTTAKLLGTKHPVFGMSLITPEKAEVSVQNADLEADFELASISKGITGLLYALALSEGEITEHTTLGELLSLPNSSVADVTLKSLSMHRSGLPSLPKSMKPFKRDREWRRHGRNPYGDSVDDLLEHARTVKLGRPRPKYSNFGFMLLGHALASAARIPYVDLIRERVFEPFQMSGAYAPITRHDLRSTALLGRRGSRENQAPWTGEGFAPAGGIRATVEDLGNFMHGLLAGDHPMLAALDPVEDFGAGNRIGAGWLTLTNDGRELTWHNGRSGGFGSIIVLDRSARVGVAIVSARSATIDRAGFRLISELLGRTNSTES